MQDQSFSGDTVLQYTVRIDSLQIIDITQIGERREWEREKILLIASNCGCMLEFMHGLA